MHALVNSNDVIYDVTVYTGMVDVSVEECSTLISQYEATDQGKVEGLMSIDGECISVLLLSNGEHRLMHFLLSGIYGEHVSIALLHVLCFTLLLESLFPSSPPPSPHLST